MAITILNLSDELLVEITKYLADDQKSRLALTLTCRRITPIAREALYRDIELDLSKDIESVIVPLCENAWCRNLSLFTKTLKNIVVHGDCKSEDYKDRHLARLLEILAEADCLRTLTIYVCSTDQIEILISAFQGAAQNPLVALKKLDIRIKTRGHSPWSAGLSSSRETRLRPAVDLHYPVSKRKLHVPSALTKRTAIRDLLISGAIMSSGAQNTILSLTPDLESLEISVPGDYVGRFVHTTGQIAQPAVLKPRELAQSLSLVRQTLRRLKITNTRFFCSGYDRSQLDFSMFPYLEDLEISSVLVLGGVSCMSKAPNINVPSLLPSNLKKLFIHFDSSQGIFQSNADLGTFTYQGGQPASPEWSKIWCEGPGKPSVITKDFSWLHDLSDKCKALEQLTLEEAFNKHTLMKGPLLIRMQGSRLLTLIDVSSYHPVFFANFPFECKVSAYVDSEWWEFVRHCPYLQIGFKFKPTPYWTKLGLSRRCRASWSEGEQTKQCCASRIARTLQIP